MALNATIDLTVKKPDFKSMKAEIKELTVAAQQAVMQFGEFSPEAIKAEHALAGARDRMEDFNDRVKAVNPDKFAQLNTVVSGVASGFAAAQGAMALFGSESKDFEKTMIKLQGAMALSQGLEGLGKVQQQFTAIAKNIGGAFTTMGQTIAAGFKVGATSAQMFKSVLSTLGIGAIIIAVGYLVDKFMSMKSSGAEAAKALAEIRKEQERLAGEIRKTSESELQTNTRLLDETVAQRKKHQRTMGILSDDFQRAEVGKDRDAINLKIQAARTKDLELELAQKQFTKNIEKINADAAAQAKAAQDKVDADAKADRERTKKEREQKQKDEAAERQRIIDQTNSAQLSANEARRQSELARIDDEGERIQKEYSNKLASLKEAQIEEQKAAKGNQDALALINQKYKDLEIVATAEVDAAELELAKKNSAEAIKIADDEAKAKADIDKKATDDALLNQEALMTAKAEMVQATRDAVLALGGLFKEGSDAAKAAALVDIAIGTGVGFINALDIAQKGAKATGPAAPFAFPIFYASQIAAVLGAANKARAILKSGKGGGPASAPSQMGGGGAPQMSAPQVSSSLPSVSGFDTKVFVTEGDIRRTTDRVDSTRKVSVVK
jgi:hypothetical protein